MLQGSRFVLGVCFFVQDWKLMKFGEKASGHHWASSPKRTSRDRAGRPVLRETGHRAKTRNPDFSFWGLGFRVCGLGFRGWLLPG